jgi:hypothetical protein
MLVLAMDLVIHGRKTWFVTVSKGKAITGLDRPTGFQEVEAPRF